MSTFDVTVSGGDYSETFTVTGPTEQQAMVRAIELARKVDNVDGELVASARVIRTGLNAEQTCMVNV
jgi:hypothetical protein